MKVLVLDGVAPKAIEILSNAGIEAVVNNNKISEEELVEIIGEYDGVIVRSATKITEKIIEAGKNLKVIGRAGVGVDNIDVQAATNFGKLVVNAPDGNTIAAAEQTITLMLAVARNVAQANENLKKGKWMRKEYLGVELRSKVLGIIGLGRIGTAVAKRAQGFEMETIGYDPFISQEKAEAIGVKLVDLNEIYNKAEFITVHMPLTKETKNLINKDTFNLMQDGVRIINVARGGIINELDLYEAVKNGKVAGAALDVFETEPTTESPLFELDNVIVTPHLGASTEEAQVNVALDVAEEMVSIFSGEMAKNAVNMPSIPSDVMVAVKPYLSLAEKLGKFISQLTTDIHSVEIIYSGDVAQLNVAPITTTLLKGLLSTILEESVNFVNAPILAKNRGMKIVESKVASVEDYANLITVKVKGKCEKEVAGTLFSGNDPRLVLIDGYRIDAIPAGYMIVAPHFDKPKIIGKVGTLIGEYDINIHTMQVGRKVIGGKAVMVLGVDGTVPEKTIKEIAEIDGIIDVQFVSL